MIEGQTLFERFGGTRPMAESLGEAPSTVQSWKTARRIPAGKQPDVLSRGLQLGLGITAADVMFPLVRRHYPAEPFLSHDDSVDPGAAVVACDRRALLHRDRAA